MPDGSIEMKFTTDPDKPQPHLAVNEDLGTFVYAVHQMPPGKSYMAEGTTCSWTDYLKLWSEITGIPTRYQKVTREEFISLVGESEMGGEVEDMYAYSSDPGYDGGVALVKAKDIQEVSCLENVVCSI